MALSISNIIVEEFCPAVLYNIYLFHWGLFILGSATAFHLGSGLNFYLTTIATIWFFFIFFFFKHSVVDFIFKTSRETSDGATKQQEK